jgi:hypothetical protein
MKKRKTKRFASLTNARINPKGFHPSQIKFYVLLTPFSVYYVASYSIHLFSCIQTIR